ncbi:hypothetical protein Echvi_3519 [Echinicola vietnamensis DSM 17526]|uniref:Uncharacterized protein n=1 Tax=Echinicola vietnamensis (strain DSM 17526 / LMG 23754 / KMM 6221) TaxID=926556 RepID=L0G4I1_ECHVK|nr:hypothetical protein Echvi_3519 [Echinicola vietnamensis DSM 17526]
MKHNIIHKKYSIIYIRCYYDLFGHSYLFSLGKNQGSLQKDMFNILQFLNIPSNNNFYRRYIKRLMKNIFFILSYFLTCLLVF